MLRLAADENFDNDILRGLRRRRPGLNLARVQDAGFSGMDDPTVLEWAASEGRILLTHDVKTVPKYAYERVGAGLPMPGVFVVGDSVSVAQAIEDLLFLDDLSLEGEWEGRVFRLPLR